MTDEARGRVSPYLDSLGYLGDERQEPEEILIELWETAQRESRQRALAEARKAMCVGCREGWPLEHDRKVSPNPWHVPPEVYYKKWMGPPVCTAQPLRDLEEAK